MGGATSMDFLKISQETLDRLLSERYDGDNISLCGYEFVGVNFKARDLSRIRFIKSRFIRCEFTYSMMTEASFLAAEFYDCDLSLVIADKAQFTDAIMTDCIMQNSFLANAKFTWATLVRTRLDYSYLSDADFFGSTVAGCSINNCLVGSTNFSSADLRDSTFIDTDLSNARTSGALLGRRIKNCVLGLMNRVAWSFRPNLVGATA